MGAWSEDEAQLRPMSCGTSLQGGWVSHWGSERDLKDRLHSASGVDLGSSAGVRFWLCTWVLCAPA